MVTVIVSISTALGVTAAAVSTILAWLTLRTQNRASRKTAARKTAPRNAVIRIKAAGPGCATPRPQVQPPRTVAQARSVRIGQPATPPPGVATGER